MIYSVSTVADKTFYMIFALKDPLLKLFNHIIFVLLILVSCLPGCTPGTVPEDFLLLTQKQDSLDAASYDSLLQIVNQRTLAFDTVSANYNALYAELNKANELNKSLRSGYYARGQQLKKANAENTLLAKTVDRLDTKNDSLQIALTLLQQEFLESENLKERNDSINAALSDTLLAIENRRIADSIAEANIPVPPKESGFMSINEVGGGFGLANTTADYSKSLLSINTVVAYRINNHFVSGFGTGLSLYDSGPMIPLYLDFRFYLKDAKFTPFIAADGGFLFVLKDFSTSGTFVNPSIGVSMKLKEKSSLHLSSGLLVQAAPAGPESGGFRRSFINFKLGISFRGK